MPGIQAAFPASLRYVVGAQVPLYPIRLLHAWELLPLHVVCRVEKLARGDSGSNGLKGLVRFNVNLKRYLDYPMIGFWFCYTACLCTDSIYCDSVTATTQSTSAKAALYMVAASVFLAVSTFLAKGVAGRFESLTQAAEIHPLQITAARFIVAWLVWVVFISIRRVPFEPVHWPLHIVRTAFGWLTVTCVFWASSLMALADATAISFLTPVVTLILAVLVLKERVGPVRCSAVAIMLFGALVLLRPGTSAFQPAALIALVAAVTSAFEAMFIKRLTAREPRVQILFINNSIGMLIAVVAAMAVWVWPTVQQSIVLLGVGLSMAVAQVFFLTSMRDGDASFVIPFMYSTLIFAGILDYAVFGDSTDAVGALGAIIIVLGAVFLALREASLNRSA